MAITQNVYTGNGSTVLYSFTFPYLNTTDIFVEVNDVLTTAYTFANETTIQFNTAPANGAKIRIYRLTDADNAESVFYPGSSIRASDLNKGFEQILYVTQETRNNSVNINKPQILGNLDFNNFKGINLATPTANADAVNKAYVDGLIQTGADNAASAAASAAAAANSYDSFDDRYLGAKTTDPSVDNDGNTLLVGATYFNSTSKVMRVWNGAAWQDASANANVLRWRKTAVGGETSLSGADDNAATLTYTVNLEFVYLNGALLQRGVDYTASNGTSITGLAALTAGDVVEVISYTSFSLVNVPGSTIQDGTVSTQKLADGAITDIKVAANAGIQASKLSFTQAGVNAVARTIDSKLKDVVSVKDFGAVGDGVADDTAAIQAAVTYSRLQGGQSRKLYWPQGTYLITAQIILGTNQSIDFDPGVTINCVPSSGDPAFTSLFVASNQSEVYLSGNGAVINGTRAGAIAEGNAAAFFIYGSDNVTIRDFVINNFATDGITLTGDVTGSGPCRNVLIQNCYVNNARRNGMSIISAVGCVVIGGEYNGSNGGPGGPWAGIDIEPNDDCFIEDVTLIGVNTFGNAGAGIQITPGALSITTGKRFHVNILGGRSLNDGDTVGVSGLYFANGGSQINKIYGEVIVRGFSVDQPKSRGVSFYNWDADKCPRAIVEDVTVYNPDSTLSASTNVDRTGFVIYADSAQAITNLGNIELRNCFAEDLRGTARMTWGMIAAADTGKAVKNVLVTNPVSINTVAANKFDFYTATSEGPGTSNGLDVVYTKPSAVSIGGSQSIAGFGGKRINATASVNLTLPSASTCNGTSYEIQAAPGVNAVTIVLQSGDTIAGAIGVASTNLVLDEGGFVRLRSQGGTTWLVEALSGRWRRAGTSAPRQIQWATAAPVSGAWTRGDKVFNADPSVGQPKGWVCTVSGTPGTWVSEGNL